MIDFTPIARTVISRRARKLRDNASHLREVQSRWLEWLIARGRKTEWGARHNFDKVKDYESFVAAQPAIMSYPDIRSEVMRMVGGERDVLWPGRTRNYAQSSGTSDGKSKYIPITADSFRYSHYRGGADVVALYLDLVPDSRIFSGKSFILGGSFANELQLPKGVMVGDLSANLIQNIDPIVNFFRTPYKKIALLSDWYEKLPALVDVAVRRNVTNISGVPSWFLTVLKLIIERKGASTIHDVWPNLEVFFHGGISMEPYREQYRHITDASRMRYLETYNASEGFFAVQDSFDARGMMLETDCGTFFEFLPLDQLDSPDAHPVPAWEVEEGKVYALIITSCNGLWRYNIGDTVKIESLAPLRISIAGRTKHYINAFGEELMVDNADKAIARVSKEMNAPVLNYTAAPVYAGDRSRGRHEWLIEFEREPDDMAAFAHNLDQALQSLNSDYQAKRAGGIFLDELTIVSGRKGIFDDWLASTGKLGGQRKIPRLSNTRQFMDPMLEMNSR